MHLAHLNRWKNQELESEKTYIRCRRTDHPMYMAVLVVVLGDGAYLDLQDMPASLARVTKREHTHDQSTRLPAPDRVGRTDHVPHPFR